MNQKVISSNMLVSVFSIFTNSVVCHGPFLNDFREWQEGRWGRKNTKLSSLLRLPSE